jgi:hypothetical protein
MGWTKQLSIPSNRKRFSFLQNVQFCSRVHPAAYSGTPLAVQGLLRDCEWLRLSHSTNRIVQFNALVFTSAFVSLRGVVSRTRGCARSMQLKIFKTQMLTLLTSIWKLRLWVLHYSKDYRGQENALIIPEIMPPPFGFTSFAIYCR